MRRCSAVIQSGVRSFWLLLVALLLAICVGTAAGADAAEDTPELLGVTPVGETDVVVAPGEPFTLAVNATVSGDLPLSYQWYRTEDSYSWESIEGATGPSWTESRAFWRAYRCDVNSERSVTFHVSSDNQMFVDYGCDPDLVVSAGEDATLSVVVSALDMEGITYEWTRKRKDEDDVWVSETIEGATGPEYTENVALSGTEYYCKVSDRYSGMSEVKSFCVTIDNALGVQAVGERDITAHPGDTVTLEAAATAVDTTGLAWQWHMAYLIDDQYYTGLLEGENGNTLAVEILPGMHEIMPWATVTDRFGGQQSLYYRIAVDNALTVANINNDLTVSPGDTVPLTVEVSARDAEGLRFEWSWYRRYADGNNSEEAIEEATGPSWSMPVGQWIVAQNVYCTVTDRYGGRIYVNFYCTVTNGLEVCPEGDAEKHIAPGGQAELRVNIEAADLSNVACQWMRAPRTDGGEPDYEEIGGADGTAYTVSADEARYDYACRVTDYNGESVLVAFRVIVDNAFTVEAHASAEVVEAGQPVTLSVSVSAIDKADITCYWDRELRDQYDQGFNYVPIPEADGPVWETIPQTDDELQEVRCQVTDRFGNRETVHFKVHVVDRIVAVNAESFPDDSFREYIARYLDSNGDGLLYDHELNGSLYLDGSVKSIEGLQLLRDVSVSWNDCALRTLVVPPCENLTSLSITSNTLTSIDLSGCPKLEGLNLQCTSLAALNLSNNPALKYLSAPFARLTSLDVSHFPLLSLLQLDEVPIEALDVSHNPELDYLLLRCTKISALDVTHNEKLTYLNIEQTNISEIDLSHNPLLGYFIAFYTDLRTLDISHNPELTNLGIMCTGVNRLDASKNPKLAWVAASDAPLEYLDVSRCPELKHLAIDAGKLDGVDVTHNPALEALAIGEARFTSLDLSHNPELKQLHYENSSLPVLDLSGNPKLEYLDVSFTTLSSALDLRANHQLAWVVLRGAVMDDVLFGNNENIVDIDAAHTSLLDIDVTGLPNLENFTIGFDNITALDVSHNPKLRTLRCDSDGLGALDVTGCPLLESLIAEGTQISELDLSHNPNLKELMCYWTNLESLDLSHNPLLGTEGSVQVYGCHMSHITLPENTALNASNFFAEDNIRCVDAADGAFDLAALEGFDVSRASDWQGGHVDGTVLTFEGNVVSYLYDCGGGFRERFALQNAKVVTVDDITYTLYPDGTAEVTRCESSGDVVIPDSVEGHEVVRLAYGAFGSCMWMTSIHIPASVTQLSNHDPVDNTSAYMFSSCRSLQAITVEAGNPKLSAIDGVLYSADGGILYCYPSGKAGEEYHIPESVIFIDDYAITDNRVLQDVYIENKDAGWFFLPFTSKKATIHYRVGGATEQQVIDEELDWLPFGEAEGQSVEEMADAVIAAQITADMDDRQKAVALHEWITHNARYSMRRDGVYSLLSFGEARCDGYADTYALLLDRVGIENRTVSGRVSNGEGHRWNQLKLDNVWYFVDCTWDDPGSGEQTEPVSGFESQQYLLVSAQFMAQNHYWSDDETFRQGWQETDDGLVFLDADGSRVTGWLQIDGGTFWFDEAGVNVIGTVDIDGRSYSFERTLVYTDASGEHWAGRLAGGDVPPHDHTLVAQGEARPASGDAEGLAPSLVCTVCGETVAEAGLIAPDAVLTLPKGVGRIEDEAFAGLPLVCQVTLPEGTTEIGSRAFADCPALRLVVLPASIQSVAPDAFEGSGLVCLMAPAGSGAEAVALQLGVPFIALS